MESVAGRAEDNADKERMSDSRQFTKLMIADSALLLYARIYLSLC